MKQNEEEYDIALSFSGKDRSYVEKVANELKGSGVYVFYDEFYKDRLWGANLYDHLEKIYSRARYVMIFISKNYPKSDWANHERRSAQSDFKKENVLPVILDDANVINKNIAYIDGRENRPDQIVDILLKKLKKHKWWWGHWKIESVTETRTGDLRIYNVSKEGFFFNLRVMNGFHMGHIEKGYAKFTLENKNLAIFEDKYKHYHKACKIEFLRKNNIIQVEENNCFGFHGMRVHYNGDYYLKKNMLHLFDKTINDFILSKIYKILTEKQWEYWVKNGHDGDNKLELAEGKYWEKFILCFNDVFEEEQDNFKGSIIKGAVPGMYTLTEGILTISENKDVAGAFLNCDTEQDEKIAVCYFSSNKKVPRVIKKWMKQFNDKNQYKKPQQID